MFYAAGRFAKKRYWDSRRGVGSPSITGRTWEYVAVDPMDYEYGKRYPWRAWKLGAGLGTGLHYLTDRQKRYFVECLIDELSKTPNVSEWTIFRCIQKARAYRTDSYQKPLPSRCTGPYRRCGTRNDDFYRSRRANQQKHTH